MFKKYQYVLPFHVYDASQWLTMTKFVNKLLLFKFKFSTLPLQITQI